MAAAVDVAGVGCQVIVLVLAVTATAVVMETTSVLLDPLTVGLASSVDAVLAITAKQNMHM